MSARITGLVLPLLQEALESVGVSGAELAPGPDFALPLTDFVRALESAAARGATPGVLWRCGQKLGRESLETLFPATRGVRMLGQALPLVAASMALAQTDSRFELRDHGAAVTFEYRVLEPAIWPRARDAELTLGFLDGVVRRFTAPDFQPHSLSFEHAPDAHSAAISGQLGHRCLFRQPSNAYSVPRALLSGSAQPAATRELAALQAALAQRDRGSDLDARIRRAVFALFGGDEPLDQAHVAARCAVSTRSLRRHLAAQGRSFREQLGQLRLEYAQAALAHTDLPIDEIARRLGYSQQSVLTRAVRRTLGASPSQLRARARLERQID
jgi:AraC-like DNA-binding protein